MSVAARTDLLQDHVFVDSLGDKTSPFNPEARRLYFHGPGVIVENRTLDREIVPENPERPPMTDERMERIGQFAARQIVRVLQRRRTELLQERDKK